MSHPATDEPDGTGPAPRRGLSRGATALVVLAALIGLGYAAMVFTVSGRDVPSGTSVRGVDIGGLSTTEAVARLEAELGDEAAAPMPLIAGEVALQLDPVEAGLSVDWEATVKDTSGLILNPVTLWKHLRGPVEVEPITTSDRDALVTALDALAPQAAVEPVEPAITYSRAADAQLEPGSAGAQIDVPAAADEVEHSYFQVPVRQVPLPMESIPTQVSAEEAQRVFDEFAVPAVGLPVTLRVVETSASGGQPTRSERIRIPMRDIAASLRFVVDGSTLTPKLNGRALHARLADELSDIEGPGRDAQIVIRSNRPVIIPSRTGRTLRNRDLADAVMPVLPATTVEGRLAEVSLSVTQPDLTTAEARALNITEKLSSFRQDFVPAEYRYVNVGEAARRINGTILKPGETFSMNGTVGERTAANGFTEGFIISGGVFREELGGGVSIITTATWTAGFYAGLERVEQHAHGLYISRYTAGLEATVAWGLLDLKMRNDTGNGVLITATRYSDGVVIEMWGTKKFDRVTATFSERTNYTDYKTVYEDSERCVPSQGVRGFSISVTRRRYIGDKVFSTETWPTTYKPTPNVVCGPEPTG